MAVMYALACMIEDGSFPEEEERKKWTAWLDEWAEWVMHGLNRECFRKFVGIELIDLLKERPREVSNMSSTTISIISSCGMIRS